MIQWLVAVIAASLFGSLHCVGMCGPFVLIATNTMGGAKTLDGSRSVITKLSNNWILLCSYHFGRLVTYLILGLLMGSIASAVQGIAGGWGIGYSASVVSGSILILLGLIRLWKLLRPSAIGVSHSGWFARWHEWIGLARRRIRTQRPAMNALAWGFLSTWLPCGWLYIFALASATAGGILSSMMMMGAFWIGTLPVLSAIAWGGTWFRKLDPIRMQWLASCLLVGFGFWTVTSRASIDLSSLAKRHNPSAGDSRPLDIEALEGTELPCCSADGSTAQKKDESIAEGSGQVK
ncbi:MAG: sulfite exporter TauE/SafE family protein [Pirellula sp.]